MHGPPAALRTRLIQAAYEAAVAEGRYEAPQLRRTPLRARLYRDGRLTLLAPYFDYAYYAETCPEFSASALDELEHYNFFGWRQRRNPTALVRHRLLSRRQPRCARLRRQSVLALYLQRPRRGPRAATAARRRTRDTGKSHASGSARRRGGRSAAPGAGRDSRSTRGRARRRRRLRLCRRRTGRACARPFGSVLQARAPLRAAPLFNALPSAWSQTQLTLDGSRARRRHGRRNRSRAHRVARGAAAGAGVHRARRLGRLGRGPARGRGGARTPDGGCSCWTISPRCARVRACFATMWRFAARRRRTRRPAASASTAKRGGRS